MCAAISAGLPSNRPSVSLLSSLVASLSPLAFRVLGLNPRALLVAGLGRESYEYMYARPWSRVVDFYAELVRAGAGAAGLAKLFAKDEVRNSQTEKEQTFGLALARLQEEEMLVSLDEIVIMSSKLIFLLGKPRI